MQNAGNIYFENIPKLKEPVTYRDSYSNEYDPGNSADKGYTEETWEYAYIVISVEGEGDVRISNISNDRGHKYTYINDISISNEMGRNGKSSYNANEKRNNEPGVSSLLYNFYEADRVILGGAFQGTILAPGAHITDEKALGNDGDNAHLSGAVIAQSFKGNVEFGYRPYTGPISVLGMTSNYEIEVNKFAEDGQTFLEGAVIGIYNVNDDGTKGTLAKSFTSSGAADMVSLEPGKYMMQEIQAPDGYSVDDKIYYFEVIEEGVVEETEVVLGSDVVYDPIIYYLTEDPTEATTTTEETTTEETTTTETTTTTTEETTTTTEETTVTTEETTVTEETTTETTEEETEVETTEETTTTTEEILPSEETTTEEALLSALLSKFNLSGA